MEFVYNDGSIVKFDAFDLNYWNLIKIRILHKDGSIEPAWVYVSTRIKELYDNEETSEIVPCVLRNGSRNFPFGSYIPLRLDGTKRPLADVSNCIGGNYFNLKEQNRILSIIYERGKRF